MLLLTLAFFVTAAGLGLGAALTLIKRRPTSKPVVVAHGVAGAAGLVLLAVYAATQPTPLLSIAVGVLVIAALGGFLLFANDMRGRPGPAPLVVVHAAAAVVGVVLVAIVALG